MLEMKNGFVVTDDDCMQCQKDLGERKFLFIQAIWMDGENEYCVVDAMEESYKLPLGQLDDFIAECSFENHPYCDWEYESEIVTRERAEEIIQKFVDTNGEVFEEE